MCRAKAAQRIIVARPQNERAPASRSSNRRGRGGRSHCDGPVHRRTGGAEGGGRIGEAPPRHCCAANSFMAFMAPSSVHAPSPCSLICFVPLSVPAPQPEPAMPRPLQNTSVHDSHNSELQAAAPRTACCAIITQGEGRRGCVQGQQSAPRPTRVSVL